MTRIKRITSHVGVYRFRHELLQDGNPIGWLPRRADIVTPYQSGPTHGVYCHPVHGSVLICETAHKRYDVFQVELSDGTIYPTDDAATAVYISSLQAGRR